MTREEAIDHIASGHGLIYVGAAAEVLHALGIKGDVPDHLIIRWTGQVDANPDNNPRGIFLHEDAPGEGVGTLSLGYYVVQQLGLHTNAGDYFGRGRQAQANAAAVRQHFTRKAVQS